MTTLPHLRAAIMRDPWAILPDRLDAIGEVIERRAEGLRLSADEIADIKGHRAPNGTIELHAMSASDAIVDISADQPAIDAARARSAAGTSDGNAPVGSLIAVINVFGIIAQHARQVDNISGPGGTSTERVGQSFRAALADPAVKAIWSAP